MKADISDTEKLLKLENIHVHYGGVCALDGVDLHIDEGEVVALMGPNGAGKSTVLKAIFGLTSLNKGKNKGKILWHEKVIHPKPHEVVPLGISFVPQGRRMLKSLTVRENLEIGAYTVKNKEIVKNRLEQVLELLPDLKKKINEKSGTLSGGQQQMLAIGRGLMVDPKVLLLDEPSLGLSPKIVKDVFKTIREINQKRKMAIIIVEHNLKSALQIVDRAYLLDKGKIVKEDKPQNLIDSGILEDVFMGRYKAKA